MQKGFCWLVVLWFTAGLLGCTAGTNSTLVSEPRYTEPITEFAGPVSMPQLPYLGRYRHRLERIVQEKGGAPQRWALLADSTVRAGSAGQRDVDFDIVEMDGRRLNYADLGISFTIGTDGGAGNFKVWGVLAPQLSEQQRKNLGDKLDLTMFGLRGVWMAGPRRAGEVASRIDVAARTQGQVQGTIDMTLKGASRRYDRAGFLLDVQSDLLLRGERQTFRGYAILDAGWGLWSSSELLVSDYKGNDIVKQTIERLDVSARD